MTHAKLLLDRPCTTDAPRFEARDDGRFCHHCREMQYDLRDATRAEVIALARSKGGRVCGQLRLGPGGEPKFKPEPPVRALEVLRSAAVAMAFAACGSPPDETSVAPEPPASTAPTTTIVEAPPPTTTVGVDPPPDAVDHSTDTSTIATDHHTHAHHHAPVPVEADPTGLGTIGSSGHPEYNGGVSISQLQAPH